MKSSKYWDKRAISRLNESEKYSEKYINRVKSIYNQAYKNIEKQLNDVYSNYSNETGIDIQKLKTMLTKSETKKTWKKMKAQGLDKYVLQNYKSRISRLEQLQAQIYAKAKEIYPKEELENTMCYKGVIHKNYYKTMYDTQMGTGYNFTFSTIDDNMINSLLNERWSGKNYSERIWGNTDILADSLSEILGGALLSGNSIELTSKQIRDRFNVSKYYAERLIRTETNHFNNESDAVAYEELNVEEYVFVATLDGRTSPICQSMDGKRFKFSERAEGINFPPLHPNCRSKTRAYLGEEGEKRLQRRARNPVTGKTQIVSNISYNEWLKQRNIINNKNGMLVTNRNVIYNTETLKGLDADLVQKNTKQLNLLLDKYPKVADFVKEKGMIFGGRKMDATAVTIHSFPMDDLSINLSRSYYSNSKNFRTQMLENINKKWCMPCNEKNIDVYALNHEFGHLIENYLINEYNINNPTKVLELGKKIKQASSKYEATQLFKNYEKNICDKIAKDIYDIALKQNKNFNLQNNLSKYGETKSQEFFAECFANMISGNKNELGKAMEIYLKGVL